MWGEIGIAPQLHAWVEILIVQLNLTPLWFTCCTVSVIRLTLTPAGSIDRGEHAVTVSYSSGQYTLCLLDHVLVRVCVEQSRSHAAALSLRLLHCGPAPPEVGGGGGGATAGGRKELVDVRS